jgi:hypothetical protein
MNRSIKVVVTHEMYKLMLADCEGFVDYLGPRGNIHREMAFNKGWKFITLRDFGTLDGYGWVWACPTQCGFLV